jgi:hypothetical protein
MSKKKSFNGFTDDWFKSRGYTPDGKDGWIAPKFKNPITTKHSVITGQAGETREDGGFTLKHMDVYITKEKVNDSPDFKVKPTTEWFVKNYNVPSKKNSRQNFVRNGKQLSIPSKIHSEYVKATKMQYFVFGREFRLAIEQLKLLPPYRVEFTFVRSSHRRFDYCNSCQTVEDLMVANKWLPDDSADYLIPVFQPYEYDKECPGVKIKILL